MIQSFFWDVNNPDERIVIELHDELYARLVGLKSVVRNRAVANGTNVPTVEEIRHARGEARVADELCGGQLMRACMSDPVEEKRLRRLTEQSLRDRDVNGAKFPPEKSN